MKLVVYRDKQTNKIKSYHECSKKVTDEMVQSINENPEGTVFVEIVEIEEDSLCYYFYTLKIIEREDYYLRLRSLERDIQDLRDLIRNELDEINELYEVEK
jgi:hypothetical protein